MGKGTDEFIKDLEERVEGKNQPVKTLEEAKFWKDKHILEMIPSDTNKETAVAITGVNPENYDKIKGKLPTTEFKKASKIFSGKMELAERFYDIQPIYYDFAGL